MRIMVEEKTKKKLVKKRQSWQQFCSNINHNFFIFKLDVGDRREKKRKGEGGAITIQTTFKDTVSHLAT